MASGAGPGGALIYRGHLVVINSGYTCKDPQTLSVRQRDTGRLEQTLPLHNPYPIDGYGGPIAALDAHRLVVGYLQAPRGINASTALIATCIP